jgi:hypothetical protein
LEIMEKQTLEVAVVEEDKEILQIHSQQPLVDLVVPVLSSLLTQPK